MTFDLADFLAPLDIWVVVLAFLIGCGLGLVLYRGHRNIYNGALFWMAAGGVVFFVPLSLLRALQGSSVWERFLATIVLWLVFILGIAVGSRSRNGPKADR